MGLSNSTMKIAANVGANSYFIATPLLYAYLVPLKLK